MSPDRKKRPSKPPRKSHARQRHSPTTAPPADPPEPSKGDTRDAACKLLTELVERLGPDGAQELIAFAHELADRTAIDVTEMLADAPSQVPAATPVPRPEPVRLAPLAASAELLVERARAAGLASVAELPEWIRARATAPEPGTTIAPPGFAEWSAFGAGLAKRPHRLALALRVARAATTGGGQLTAHEEDAICSWCVGVVDLAIERTGGPQPGRLGGDDNAAASTIWHVLVADAHADPRVTRPARCPAVAACPAPGERDFLAGLRAAAEGYVRTAIVGASPAEVDALCSLLVASDATLETYRPFNGPFGSDEHNTHAAEVLEPALASLVKRRISNAEICSGVAGYASGWAQIASEHAIPPVARIGLIAWLAKVALAPAPTAPPTHETPEGALAELLAEDLASKRGIFQEGQRRDKGVSS
jgi:hypothetical protein